MPQINIDYHILKKVVANYNKIESNMKRMTVLFLEAQELHGENKALLQFIESVCNNAENKT